MAAAPCGELDRDLVRLNDTLSAVSFPHISAVSNPNTIPTSGYAALRRAIGGKSVKSSVKANFCVPIVADCSWKDLFQYVTSQLAYFRRRLGGPESLPLDCSNSV